MIPFGMVSNGRGHEGAFQTTRYVRYLDQGCPRKDMYVYALKMWAPDGIVPFSVSSLFYVKKFSNLVGGLAQGEGSRVQKK